MDHSDPNDLDKQGAAQAGTFRFKSEILTLGTSGEFSKKILQNTLSVHSITKI